MSYQTVCCIKGCEEPVEALGLCVAHYRRNRQYGSPVALTYHAGLSRGLPAEARFFQRVRKTDACWIWLGGRDVDGYGVFRGAVGDVVFKRAHRFSYAYHTGDLTPGMHVLHSCDNPCCVNPAHLSAGTNADNMRDKAQKGRSRVRKGQDAPQAILTDEQVLAIRRDPRPHTELAVEFGVTAQTIRDVKNLRSWMHLDAEVIKSVRIGNRGEKSYAAKITAEDVREIRSSNLTGRELAQRYGVSPQSITDIRKFRSWKHL